MSVSCRAHGCIFLSFLLKRQKITTVGSERQKITTVGSERQKKSAMGRSVPKRWAQVDFTARWTLGGSPVISCEGREMLQRTRVRQVFRLGII